MVARGDLGVEWLCEVTSLQKTIIHRSRPVPRGDHGTQIWNHDPEPGATRAEFRTSPMRHGPDAVMLSAETATGLIRSSVEPWRM